MAKAKRQWRPQMTRQEKAEWLAEVAGVDLTEAEAEIAGLRDGVNGVLDNPPDEMTPVMKVLVRWGRIGRAVDEAYFGQRPGLKGRGMVNVGGVMRQVDELLANFLEIIYEQADVDRPGVFDPLGRGEG